MKATDQLKAQIERSTQRLAQLQARELIAQHRTETKDRAAARRADAHRKDVMGGLVIASGCSELPPGEIVGALLAYRSKTTDPAQRQHHRMQGELHLAKLDRGSKIFPAPVGGSFAQPPCY